MRVPIHASKSERSQTASPKFGFTNPILIDAKSRIVAGHGRAAAAKMLGLESVPTIAIEHLNEAKLRAYVLADNRLAEEAGWDKDILRLEFQHLSSLELDFDLTLTGFEVRRDRSVSRRWGG